MEWLITIATLCQVSANEKAWKIEEQQHECQKWYINCIEKKLEKLNLNEDDYYVLKKWSGPLKECVLEKK